MHAITLFWSHALSQLPEMPDHPSSLTTIHQNRKTLLLHRWGCHFILATMVVGHHHLQQVAAILLNVILLCGKLMAISLCHYTHMFSFSLMIGSLLSLDLEVLKY